MKTHTLIFLFLFSLTAFAQSQIQGMFNQKRYTEIIAFAPNASKYSGQDIFRIGQSFMKLERDEEAVNMFDQAIEKGYKNGEIYYAKGIAETNLQRYSVAQVSFRQALFYLPKRKKVLIELAGCYYKAQELDSALSVYQEIESNWGDYYPALLMTCQIMHEQEAYAKALDCYYTKLPALKKDNYYYREALESVMRLEWQVFKRYDKAETAIKNLMTTFPDDYEYNILLMQLYNNTRDYEKAQVQEEYIMAGYKGLKLANSYYQKGAMIVEQLDTLQYHIEVYRNFQPEMENDCIYKAYIFNSNGTRPLGKIAVNRTDTISQVSGYNIDIPKETNATPSYQEFKNVMLMGLFLPELPDTDTITED